MSYDPITEAEIEVGEPIKNSTLDKMRLDLDDHEDRLATVEASSVVFPPIIMRVSGGYGQLSPPCLNLLKTTINFAINITGVRILIDEAGSAGSTEIDLKVSRSGGAFTTIFTSKPTIAYTAGSNALSSAGTQNGTDGELASGDIIRLDLTAVQTDGVGFLVRIDWNRTFSP